MEMRKRDLILIGIILVIAAGGFFINAMIHRKPAATVEVSVDGTTTQVYDLNKNTDVVIEGYAGGTNHLIIEDGNAWISEATCPDKVCVHQGRVNLNGDLLVCLPNRLIVKIVAPES